jgi:hypothetical protein
MLVDTLWTWLLAPHQESIVSTMTKCIQETEQCQNRRVPRDVLLCVHQGCGALRLHGVSLFAIVVVLMMRGNIGVQSANQMAPESLEPQTIIDAAYINEINALMQKLYATAKFKSPTRWTGQSTHAMLINQHANEQTHWRTLIDCTSRCVCCYSELFPEDIAPAAPAQLSSEAAASTDVDNVTTQLAALLSPSAAAAAQTAAADAHSQTSASASAAAAVAAPAAAASTRRPSESP